MDEPPRAVTAAAARAARESPGEGPEAAGAGGAMREEEERAAHWGERRAARERDRSASPPPPAGHASSYKQFKFRAGAKQYAEDEASLGANGYPGIVKAADWPGWRLRRQAVAPDQLPPAEELDRTAAPEGAWEGVADAERSLRKKLADHATRAEALGALAQVSALGGARAAVRWLRGGGCGASKAVRAEVPAAGLPPKSQAQAAAEKAAEKAAEEKAAEEKAAAEKAAAEKAAAEQAAPTPEAEVLARTIVEVPGPCRGCYGDPVAFNSDGALEYPCGVAWVATAPLPSGCRLTVRFMTGGTDLT